MSPVQRLLIAIGAILLVAGIFWPWLAKLGLGRLPGDIRIETEHGFFYFPITTCVIVSIVISLVVWFVRR
jgi:heme/copper-type cytochrome/quinol oxidase subunit 2